MKLEEVRKWAKDNWWNDHLEWMLENEPQLAKSLFEKDPEKLAEHLSRVVKRAFNVWTNSKKEDREALDYAVETVVSPPPPENPPEPLPEELEEKIRAWGEEYGIEDRTE